MDFKHMKADIKEISDIASSAPEPFRNKCFEVPDTGVDRLGEDYA